MLFKKIVRFTLSVIEENTSILKIPIRLFELSYKPIELIDANEEG